MTITEKSARSRRSSTLLFDQDRASPRHHHHHHHYHRRRRRHHRTHRHAHVVLLMHDVADNGTPKRCEVSVALW